MILAALALAAAPVALPANVNQTVQVGEHRYRVRVKGRVVKVFQKKAIARPDPETGLEMKQAVRVVTGCGIAEEHWQASRLVGLLDCRHVGAPGRQ